MGAFPLQPATRTDAIEITIGVELQEIARRVARPHCRLRLDPLEPRSREIKAVHEDVDESHRVFRVDVIVDHFRQQKKLVARESWDVRHARF
jgi:hypothetical protein